MTRLLFPIVLSLFCAACASPDTAGRDNRPNDHVSVGQRGMAGIGSALSPSGASGLGEMGSDKKDTNPDGDPSGGYYGVPSASGKTTPSP